jgi:acetyltransferase-like isoleucine patch superfamily enzyme
VTTPVTVPWTDVNSDTAFVVEWRQPDRADVRAGSVVVDVETSKAALEIVAPCDGVMLQLVPAGAQITIGQPIAQVFEDHEALTAFEADRLVTAERAAAVNGNDAQIRATDRARVRARELGVDLTTLAADGLITVKHVETAAGPAAEPQPAVQRAPLPGDGAAQRLLIVGAGLGATQVLDIVAETPGQQGVAVVDDDPATWGRDVRGLPVVGGSDAITGLWEANAFDAAVIAISTSVAARARLRALCRDAAVPLANVIDPRAKLATGVQIGTGNVICAFTHFGTEARIGENNFISAYNSFDHHNVLGSDISTGPGCMTSGEVHLEDRVRLGTGIFVEPKLTLGEGAIISSGAIVVRSVPAAHIVKTKVVTTTVVPIRS